MSKIKNYLDIHIDTKQDSATELPSILDCEFLSHKHFDQWHDKFLTKSTITQANNSLPRNKNIQKGANDNSNVDISSEATILMIDDDDICLCSMEIILMSTPYILITLNSSKDAFKYIHSNSEIIDLIFLDLNMPDISGLELLEAIKHEPSISKIPVILQSATTDNNKIMEAYILGIAAHLEKPYNKEQVLAVIRKVLN